MKDKKIKIGRLLLESLTREQIACMLEVVASAGGLISLMDDFKKADKVAGEDLCQFLGTGKTGQMVSGNFIAYFSA